MQKQLHDYCKDVATEVSTAIAGGDAKAVALSAGIGAVGGLIGASGLPAVAQIVA